MATMRGMYIEFENYRIDFKIGDWVCKQKFNGKAINTNYFTLTNAEFREKFLPLI
jgi:hypothetical protein